jgi:tRNA A37 threonylcarbamoyladenosine biosynthesis protein TsaE
LLRWEDLLSLGFKKMISDPQNIVAVEWADKIRKNLPKNAMWIKFIFINDKKRKLTF